MLTTDSAEQVGVRILDFLEEEEQFLNRVEERMTRLADQRVGTELPPDLLEDLLKLESETQERRIQRGQLQWEIASVIGDGDVAARISSLPATSLLSDFIQEKRQAVFERAIAVESKTRAVAIQLTESNAVVSAVLTAFLGLTVNDNCYDGHGRLVS